MNQKKFSFELFPPRTPESAERLPGVIRKLAALGPEFFSITYGAGGSTQEGTYETLRTVVEETGSEAMPHLTCVGSTAENIAALLDRYKADGVRRILALRGDLPVTAGGVSAPGEFHYANELVSFIRQHYGDHFLIDVAAYPEMHIQATNPTADFENFRRKVEAGANSATTQFFYNPASYFDFVERCQKAGITIPIVPGIMPLTGFANVVRISNACGADLPRWVRLRLEELQDDKPSLLAFGIDVVTSLCETLLANGAPSLHFYTINQSEPTLTLCRNLGLGATE